MFALHSVSFYNKKGPQGKGGAVYSKGSGLHLFIVDVDNQIMFKTETFNLLATQDT